MNLKDISIFVAWSWKLSSSLRKNLADEAYKFYTGIGGNYIQGDHYKVGNLWKPIGRSIWIITTTREWVKAALEDFIRHDIPTIIASTDIPDVIEHSISIPVCEAPNLAFPVIELMQVIGEMDDVHWLNLEVSESHQAGKKDPSGTALDFIQLFRRKWGHCIVANEQKYNPTEWVSDLEALRCYRWESSKKIWVPEEFMNSHAYHTYKVFWKKWEILSRFKTGINTWVETNQWKSWCEVFLYEWNDPHISEDWNEFYFGHNINGLDIYSQWVQKLIPWILEQEPWVYSPRDFLKQ